MRQQQVLTAIKIQPFSNHQISNLRNIRDHLRENPRTTSISFWGKEKDLSRILCANLDVRQTKIQATWTSTIPPIWPWDNDETSLIKVQTVKQGGTETFLANTCTHSLSFSQHSTSDRFFTFKTKTSKLIDQYTNKPQTITKPKKTDQPRASTKSNLQFLAKSDAICILI